MKFPVRLAHGKSDKVWATIYAKTPAHPVYRLYWRVGRKSHIREFAKFSAAKREGEKLAKNLAEGTQVATLSRGQASDAIAAFQRLDRYFQATGRRVSLLEGISQYCESAAKLSGQAIGDAIDRYLATVAVVRRKPLAEAVAEFILARKPLSESEDGKRSKHSPVYESHVAAWLGDFAGTFPGYAVCDLNKEHLNTYIAKFKELSGKSRNDRRGTAKMFLRWATQKDYLPQNHRLFEAVGFKPEDGDVTEIDFYRPKELRDMLNAADEALLPVIALGGLAGLRREEIMRLEWADVWRVEGKVEISARIAKGRKRRLVDICPALAEWLQSYRKATGLVWTGSASGLEAALRAVREATKIPSRRNGLRHAFITFHFAMHTNENLTAAEAGNSPLLTYVLLRYLSYLSNWAHSFTRLFTILRAALWEKYDLLNLLACYGTAGGSFGHRARPEQAYFHGFLGTDGTAHAQKQTWSNPKRQSRKNQNLILRQRPRKPLKINGTTQNFSPYETGVNVIHADNSASRIKGDPKQNDWYYYYSYIGWDPPNTYNGNPL